MEVFKYYCAHVHPLRLHTRGCCGPGRVGAERAQGGGERSWDSNGSQLALSSALSFHGFQRQLVTFTKSIDL